MNLKDILKSPFATLKTRDKLNKIAAPKKSKYNNINTKFNNILFDSKVEMEFYIYLLSIYHENDIRLQPKFLLQPKFELNKEKIREIYYIADFQVNNDVYDVKGVLTKDFIIKSKLFKFKYRDNKLYIVKKIKGKWVY